MNNPQTNSPDDTALFHIGKIAKAAKDKGQTDAALRNAFKAADQAGVNIQAVKIARKIADSKDAGEVLETLRQAIRYAQLLGVDEARQMDLFAEVKIAEEPIEERAFQAGYRDAMAGENSKNPHDPSTAAFRRYEAGYTEGATKVDFLERDIGTEIVGRAPGADTDEADMFDGDDND